MKGRRKREKERWIRRGNGREEEGRGERREREKEDRNALAEDEIDRQNCM